MATVSDFSVGDTVRFPNDDVITQESVIGLLDMVEDHGPIYAEERNALFPTLCEYTSRHRWLAPMSNGVARATVQGEALRRFAALAAS